MKHFLLWVLVRYKNLKSSFGRLRQNVAPKSLQHDYFFSFKVKGRLFMASLIILLIMVIDYFLMRVKHALL